MRTLCAFLIGGFLGLCASTRAGSLPTPPGQPPSGPGGAAYEHKEIVAKLYGDGATAYWIFEPAAPTPKQAPLIVFLHGWSAMQPRVYGAWIEHLAKRGNIVVYPLYQDSLRTPVADFTPNAIAAVTSAIGRLQSEPGHVKPELDKFALVGHSMGGVIGANLAALWEQAGLPAPRALMCVEPGKTWNMTSQIAGRMENLSRIPKDTLLLTVVGDSDRIVRDIDAKRIFRESTQIPPGNKNYVTLVSDAHGEPALQATHMAPVAPGGSFAGTADGKTAGSLRERFQERMAQRRAEQQGGDTPDFDSVSARGVDALDYFGTWKLLDALTDAAFHGRNRNFALGNTPEQRFMGVWSDGTPVKEMAVSENP